MTAIRHAAVIAVALAFGWLAARASTPPPRRQDANLRITEHGTDETRETS
jgi:hypothetical protein